MQEILKMVIEPSFSLDGWKMYWMPNFGFKDKMDQPISLDPQPFRQAIAALKNHSSLRNKNIGTSSGEMYLFIDSNAIPGDMRFIDETIQHAYFINLKKELPKWLPTMATTGPVCSMP